MENQEGHEARTGGDGSQESGVNTSWHSYPSIYALGHSAITELLSVPVIVQEKVDGSQFSFGVFDGQIRVRSKGKQMEPDAPEKMFSAGVDWVKANAHNLIDGWTYRGEYLQKPKHNALAYSRHPNNHIILFDINIDHELYANHEDVSKEAERIGLESVPMLFYGNLTDMDVFTDLLDRESVLGGVKIEGVVIKPAGYDLFGRDKKVLMGKYVSEAFKEVHAKEWKKSNPSGKDVIGLIGESLRTDARWHKSVQHLAERGEVEGSPRDIGPLINEVKADLRKECLDDVTAQVMKWAWPHIERAAIRGLPEWYKDELTKKQFGEP